MVRITCPHCNSVFAADANQDGDISCPKCQGRLSSSRALALGPQPHRAKENVRRLRIFAYGAVGCVFLSILIVFGWRYFGNDVKATTAKIKAREIAKACERYFVDHGQYPASLEELLAADQDGKGPYLKSDTIKDPWGNMFTYDPSGSLQTSQGAGIVIPDVYCTAPDGRKFGNW